MSWIGVDLDGTLAHYDGWVEHTDIGKPIPEMVERVKKWLEEGIEVRIFTARMADPDMTKVHEFVDALHVWLKEHIGTVLEVTNVKDFKMVELWDDRAITVEQNTGKQLGPSQSRFS